MPRMLTDAYLRNLNKPGKHFDGGGLYLELTKAGGRYWRLKYRVAGVEKRLALGVALLQYSKYQVMPPVVRGKLQG